MAFDSGNNAGHEPTLETKFNHGHERAILIEGGEAFAHVVRFTHRAKLHRSMSAAPMMAHPRRLPHSILTDVNPAACSGDRGTAPTLGGDGKANAWPRVKDLGLREKVIGQLRDPLPVYLSF